MSPQAPADSAVLVTPKMLAAAWATWHSRHGGRLGPGPAFTEALAAGLAVALIDRSAAVSAMREQCAALVEELCGPPDPSMGFRGTENEIARRIRTIPIDRAAGGAP